MRRSLAVLALTLTHSEALEPTVPGYYQSSNCAVDKCALAEFTCLITSFTDCSTFTDAETLYEGSKGYRLSSATAYNSEMSSSIRKFCALELEFAPIDPTAGLPINTIFFGDKLSEDPTLRETATFTDEINEIELIWNSSPYWEGIIFYDFSGG